MSSLSVVIPCYNGMPYLETCINSILDQDLAYIDWVEVIVVDDCSTDNSREYVKEISEQAHAINSKVSINLVARKENSGNGALPRNDGIQRAMGDYLFLIDADDYFSPGALDKMVAHAVEWNSDVLVCKHVGENGRGTAQSMFHASDPRADIYTSNVVYKLSNHGLYRTKFLKDNHIFNPCSGPTPAEDWDFILKAYLQAKVLSVAADYAYYHFVYTEDRSVHLSEVLINASYTSKQWYSFWSQLLKDVEQYADLSKIYFRIIPKLANARLMVFIMLRDMFSDNESTENFLPVIALWKKWFSIDLIRASGGSVSPEVSTIIQAASTENVDIIREAFEAVKSYCENSRFPDSLLSVTPEKFSVVLTHGEGCYECDISKEVKFGIDDISLQYESNLFIFDARIQDCQHYLLQNAQIDLVFIDEKHGNREVFPMEKTGIDKDNLLARCMVNPLCFKDKYDPAIRWDLYIEISSPLIGTRVTRIGHQGDESSMRKTLEESLIAVPSFCFRGYLSPAKNICFKQTSSPDLKFSNVELSYDNSSQEMVVRGRVASFVAFDGNEQICINLSSSTGATTIPFRVDATLDDGTLNWCCSVSLPSFIGAEKGQVRWDPYFKIQSPKWGEKSVRLGSQTDAQIVVNSINDASIMKDGYRLKCYLSPAKNICFEQIRCVGETPVYWEKAGVIAKKIAGKVAKLLR